MTDSHHDFAGLVARYQGAVCAVAYAVLRDRARSEEVAQDAFLIAWQKLPGMSPAPVLPGWVCGIARNLARNAARRRKETEMIAEPTATSTPLDSLLDRESELLAQRALAELGDRERDAVVLYYRGDQSMKEVAGALGISEAAAKKRVLRGREHLRSAVAAVESALRATRPGPAFTAGCVAALAAAGTGAGASEASAATASGKTALPRGIVAVPIAAAIVAGIWAVDRFTHTPSPDATARAAALDRRVVDDAVVTSTTQPALALTWRIDAIAKRALHGRIEAARTARVAAAGSAAAATAPTVPTDDKIRVYDFSGGALLEPPPAPKPRKPGPLGKHDLRAAIHSVQPLLAECYRAAEPSLARKDGTINVVIRLEGEPDVGTVVTDAKVGGDAHLVDAGDLAECFRETLLSIEMPGLADPGVFDVHYPFTIPPGS
jgi:RNA polymerase sigma factor (sigma-70 family)